jgi:hypothetical protein
LQAAIASGLWWCDGLADSRANMEGGSFGIECSKFIKVGYDLGHRIGLGRFCERQWSRYDTPAVRRVAFVAPYAQTAATVQCQ